MSKSQSFGLDWILVNKHLHEHAKKAKADAALNPDKESARASPSRSGWKCCLLLQVRVSECCCC